MTVVLQTTLPPWLKQLYPFRISSVRVGSEHMSYAQQGDPSSPPLIMVHGNPTWSFLWRNIIPKLSPRFNVIAPDNIGFGLSSKPEDATYHTLARHIDNLGALIDELGLKQVTLVANGWGGALSLGYATRYPENVSRVVLINSWIAPWSAVKLPWTFRLVATSFGPALVLRGNRVIKRVLNMFTRKQLSPDTIRAYTFPFSRPSEREALLAFFRMRAPDPADSEFDTLAGIASRLPSLPARVDILWGELDPILPGKVLPYLLRDQFANAQAPLLLPQCSHLVPEDDPSAVIDKILEVFKPKPQPAMFNILK